MRDRLKHHLQPVCILLQHLALRGTVDPHQHFKALSDTNLI